MTAIPSASVWAGSMSARPLGRSRSSAEGRQVTDARYEEGDHVVHPHAEGGEGVGFTGEQHTTLVHGGEEGAHDEGDPAGRGEGSALQDQDQPFSRRRPGRDGTALPCERSRRRRAQSPLPCELVDDPWRRGKRHGAGVVHADSGAPTEHHVGRRSVEAVVGDGRGVVAQFPLDRVEAVVEVGDPTHGEDGLHEVGVVRQGSMTVQDTDLLRTLCIA